MDYSGIFCWNTLLLDLSSMTYRFKKKKKKRATWNFCLYRLVRSHLWWHLELIYAHLTQFTHSVHTLWTLCEHTVNSQYGCHRNNFFFVMTFFILCCKLLFIWRFFSKCQLLGKKEWWIKFCPNIQNIIKLSLWWSKNMFGFVCGSDQKKCHSVKYRYLKN